MNAQRFHGAADGPDLLIYRAADGGLLPGSRGWTCGACETIFVTEAEAERCCSDQVERCDTADQPIVEDKASRPALKLFVPAEGVE